MRKPVAEGGYLIKSRGPLMPARSWGESQTISVYGECKMPMDIYMAYLNAMFGVFLLYVQWIHVHLAI